MGLMTEEKKSGFLLIDKPKGWTSFDVVAKLRTITGVKKIGHAGTLDPIATGLLVVAVGREATKQIDQYLKLDKVYIARAKLGETTDTYDAEGNIKTQNVAIKTESELLDALDDFKGEIDQVPPMFSAKKIGGKKLYELARQGKEVERQPVKIKIYDLKLLNFAYPWLEIEVRCSSGTYIRSLINDLGEKLGVGAVMYELRRIKIGDFSIKKAALIEQLSKGDWFDFLI
jgi:tRNA pseudouridine55 synthase